MKKYILISLALVFFGSTLYSQDKHTKKADKFYDRLEYVKAVQQYEKLLKKHSSAYVYQRLGDSYNHLGDFKQAALYYGKYVDKAEATGVGADYYYKYAQVLKSIGADSQYKTYMQKFADAAPSDARARAFKANANYLSDLLNRDQEFELTPFDMNSDFADFGAYEHNDKLYFVSARNKSRRTHQMTGQPTLDVYVATKKSGGYGSPVLLKGDVNTKFNEGNIVITKDNQTAYFTRNDYTNNKFRKDENGIGQLKVYRARNVNGSWTDVDELPFNSSEYSTGNVALSPDENWLYFASDRPGGYGGSDLYRVKINSDGSFGEPENLGPEINTPGRESFPYIDANGVLYFSSDGHMGMGGLDVFKATPKGNSFGNVENMGNDINSRADDFSFAWYPNEYRGYVSSNRTGKPTNDSNIANDNIYVVNEVQKVDIYVQVTDEETGKPIANAEVTVYNNKDLKVEQKRTDSQGRVSFNLPGGDSRYNLQLSANDYHPAARNVPHQLKGEISVDVSMKPIEPEPEEEIAVSPIHFEYDKSDITNEAAFELDKVAAIMKKYPGMTLKIIGHTDRVASVRYNQKLSERRANSALEYLTDKGIDTSRMVMEGRSKLEPKIDCKNCTAEQDAINRRVEFELHIK